MYRKDGFRVVTTGTQDKFLDENVKHLLQFPSLVRTIDDETIVLDVELRLSSQFTAKKLGGIYRKNR